MHLDLIGIFIDENVSGYTPLEKRPEGSKLISLLTKDVKAVVSIKPDRLFRNTIDALTTVDKWDKMGIELHMVDMGGATLATKTAMGKMLFSVLIVFSQFERDITGERTSAILSNKKADGKIFCNKIIGYDKVNGQLVENEEEQKVIKTIFDLDNEKVSLNEIARFLNKSGVKTKTDKLFYPSTVRAILQNKIHTTEKEPVLSYKLSNP